MKRLAALAAVGCVAACAGIEPGEKAGAPGLALANPGFEQAAAVDQCPPGWSCIVHGAHAHTWRSEGGSAGHGARSLCVDPLDPVNNWLFVYQVFPAERLRGARVRVSALVRTTADPGGGAGPLVLAVDGHGATRAHEQRLVRDSGGWKRAAAEIVVPPDAYQLHAGVNFESHARACADDVRVEILPPA